MEQRLLLAAKVAEPWPEVPFDRSDEIEAQSTHLTVRSKQFHPASRDQKRP